METLNFAAGQTVTWENIQFLVERELGSGLTSNVFRGIYKSRQVAIKILNEKYARAENIRQAFQQEYDYLLSLWESWANRYPDQPHVTPEYITGSMSATPPFFMMELINGVPIDDNLAAGQPMENEQDAVSLMRQFGQLLTVLHLDLKKTYADIKFTNLWILNQRDKDGQPLLKVTDWNVLADVNPDDPTAITRDLFFASLYFYRLATGVMPPYRNGRVQIRLENDNFKNLTPGARAFVLKGLHPNPLARYATAQEWTDAISALYTAWTTPIDTIEFNAMKTTKKADEITSQARDLIEQARLAADQPSGDAFFQKAASTFNQANEQYSYAKNLLDMAQRKGRGTTVGFRKLLEQVNDGLQKTSYLERGQVALLGASYREAMQEYDMGARVSLFESEPLRRWYWLASAAYELGVTEFEKIRQIALDSVEALTKGEFSLADDRLEQVSSVIGENRLPVGLQALRNEVKIYLLARSAQEKTVQDNFPEALKDYEQAQILARALPKEPPTRWAEDLGDLSTLVQRARHEYETTYALLENLKQAKTHFTNQEWDAASHALLVAAVAVPDDPRPGAVWVDAINERLSVGDLDQAYRLAEQSLSAPGTRAHIRPLWQIISTLQEMRETIQLPDSHVAIDEIGQTLGSQPGDDDHQKNDAGTVLHRFYEIANDYQIRHAGNFYALGKTYTQILINATQRALTEQNIDYAIRILALLRALDVTGDEISQLASRLNEQIDAFRVSLLADLKQELTIYLSQAKLYHRLDLFEKADKLASHLENHLLSPDDKVDNEWLYLLQDTHNACKGAKEQAVAKLEYNQSKVQKIIAELSHLEREWQENQDRLASLPTSTHLKIRETYAEISTGLSTRIWALLTEWQQLDPENSQPREKIDQHRNNVDNLGLYGWAEVLKTANQSLEFINLRIKNAQVACETGDLLTAEQMLKELEAYQNKLDEFEFLNEKVDLLKEFMKWSENCKKDATLLPDTAYRDIYSWQEKKVPAAYWSKSGIQTLFQEKPKAVYKNICDAKLLPFTTFDSQSIEYLVTFLNWLQVARLVDFASGDKTAAASLPFAKIFETLTSSSVSYEAIAMDLEKTPIDLVRVDDLKYFLAEKERQEKERLAKEKAEKDRIEKESQDKAFLQMVVEEEKRAKSQLAVQARQLNEMKAKLDQSMVEKDDLGKKLVALERTKKNLGTDTLTYIFSAIIVGIALLLGAGIGWVVKPASPPAIVAPTATVAKPTKLPTNTPTASPTIESNTPTTPIPAETLVPSETPVPLPTAAILTEAEQADFLKTYPDFPAILKNISVANSAIATYLPDSTSWFDEDKPEAAGQKMKYISDLQLTALKGQTIQVKWPITQSVAEAGYYSFWIEDTQTKSGTGDTSLTYQVFSGQHGPLTPSFGTNQAKLVKSAGYKPKNPFVNIGVYHLDAGESIDVVLDITNIQFAPGSYIGVDRVVMAHLPGLTGDGVWNQNPNIKDRTIFFWADDALQAPDTRKPAEGWVPVQIPPEQAVAYWDGNAQQIALTAENAGTAEFTWSFPYIQGPGKFQVGVLVPPALDIPVVYEVYLDDSTTPLTQKQISDPAGSGVRGTLLELFDTPYDLPDGPHSLRVLVKVYTGADKKDGLLVVDAAIILQPK